MSKINKFSDALNHMDQASQEIGIVLLEIFIVVSFTTSIAYFLLNAFPKKISSSGTSFEMTFLCGNKICFQKEHVKVISMVDNGMFWNAVLFIKKGLLLLIQQHFLILRNSCT